MAAISPSLLFLLLKANWSASHVDVLLWCGANAIAAIAVLAPWPHAPSTPRLAYLHRLAASVLTVFVLAHVVNQALAFISPPAYAAMRNVMRVASQQSISYLLLIGAVAIQIVTGTAMGLKHVRAGAFGRNLQAVSGWCLAAFLLAHVFSPLLLSAPPVAPSGAAFDQFHLLATPRGAAQLPFLVLGVAAFLFHVGAYARLAALAYFAEASVRRLSYAGALVGTGVVVAVGLALCGVHF
jgi:succinate dehydrogenase/fumarate reductase cytochrome b subunit